MAKEIKTTMENTQATTEVWATMDDFIFDDEKCIIGIKNPDITHIRFPEGITDIGEIGDILEREVRRNKINDNFGNNLQYIYIPESVKNIGDNAFIYNSYLRTVEFAKDSKLSYIGRSAFQETGIEILKLPDNAETEQSAFAKCESLHTVILAKNVSYIEDNAFNGCVSLKNVTWPKNVEDIGHYSFMGTALEVLDLAHCTELYYISAYAFANCKYLHTIKLPATTNRISLKSFAFANCTALQYIDKPPITKLITCPETFEGCYKLTTTEDEGTSKKDAADAYLMRRGILL